MKNDYSVLLYCYYTPVADPELLRAQQEAFCKVHRLKGRIVVATEGLNGTISGLHADCEAYMDYVLSDARFAKMEFKIHGHDRHAFAALHVRVKREIVHAGLPDIQPYEAAAEEQRKTSPATPPGIPVRPAELAKALQDPNVVLLDVRSSHEHRVGRFKGSITLDIDNFRDLPGKLHELLPYKDKKIIVLCTGDIKSTKASAYLKSQGFPHVYRLAGGVVQYGLDTDGSLFEGLCYVFDNRLTVPINKVNPTVVDKCFHCKTPCERLVNCANAACNHHISLCLPCARQMEGACSPACQKHPEKRPYHPSGYYTRPGHQEGYAS